MVKCCDACTKEKKKHLTHHTGSCERRTVLMGGGYKPNTGNANRKYSGLLTTKKQNEKTSIASDGLKVYLCPKKEGHMLTVLDSLGKDAIIIKTSKSEARVFALRPVATPRVVLQQDCSV